MYTLIVCSIFLMNKSMPKKHSSNKPGERLLALFTTLLISRRPRSLSELAQEFSCSKPSILRDLVKIEEAKFGKILRIKNGKEVQFSMDKPHTIPSFALNAEGLYQLALCYDFLFSVLPEEIQKEIRLSLTQAATFLPSGQQSLPDGVGQSLSKGRIDYTPFQNILKTL